MTHKERILMAARGEMPDILPYVPRFDLWYTANSWAGTLPERHRGRTADEIARAEGWALHKVIPELLKVESPEDNLHRGIGLYSLKENGYRIELTGDIEVKVEEDGLGSKFIQYHTPKGTIRIKEVITEEMKKAGASITWLEERAIKTVEDYKIMAYIFENVKVVPAYDRYARWQQEVGEDGVACLMGSFAASPMQHIQRDLLEATEFFFEYNDHQNEMRLLEESLEQVYRQLLDVVADSPAEVVLWGANYDDTITYPPYFEKEILPWLQKAAQTLESKGKLLICHCDGENLGLMDLIKDSGIHIAEAVCPHPMTKVTLEEYYRKWGDNMTIFGGIPQSLLLEETASDEDFEAYLDYFFRAVAPGRRIIAGIADTTPPNAVFDRLVRIGERIQKEGRLPLEGGSARPMLKAQLERAAERVSPHRAAEKSYQTVYEDVLRGDHQAIQQHVRQLLDEGHDARAILNQGMLSAMEVIGGRFKAGEVFIPEVLLSARAMNEALKVLEPYLASGERESSGKILIGTVRGDLHDIGKNMVSTMLRGVGFEIRDLGINVPTEEFVRQVADYKPDILGLSALLTTTMPEMKRVIDALQAEGLRNDVKVMVGGAPVNERFAQEIGADGYAPDAGEAVALAKRLIQGR